MDLKWEVEWVQLCLLIRRICGTTNLRRVRRIHVTAAQEVHRRRCWGSLIPEGGTEAVIDFVSYFYPALSLQFTSIITETELPFLDINLRISHDRIQTSVF